MSINKPPYILKPSLLCKEAPKEGTILSGEFPLDKITNLNSELKKQGLTPITYHLQFYNDEHGFQVVKGSMVGDFELTCQRCMQPMRYTLKADIFVSPVNSYAEAKQLPERYEPLLMTNSEINFAEWIAEELHLALPLVPRHDAICVSYDSFNQDQTGE